MPAWYCRIFDRVCAVSGNVSLHVFSFQSLILSLLHRAKHALAMVVTILNMFGYDQGLGYDINYVFEVTVHHSSLKNKAVEKCLQCVIDAFHCWAHKRACQLKYHPLYQPAFGLKDLLTCERLFSSLNGTARNIQHSSAFRWM